MKGLNTSQVCARLLKAAEVSKILRVHPRTLRKWQSRGLIPFRRIGHTVLFHPEDVQEAVKRARVDNHPPAKSPPPAA